MIILYLASPSVYIFSHFGSSTLGLPKHRVMHTHTCTHQWHHTLVFDFALDIQRLCILGTSIPHNSNLLVYGFALDTRMPCTFFSGFIHKSRQPPSTEYQTLGQRRHLGGAGGPSPPPPRKKKKEKKKEKKKKEKEKRKKEKKERRELWIASNYYI